MSLSPGGRAGRGRAREAAGTLQVYLLAIPLPAEKETAETDKEGATTPGLGVL